MLMLQINVMYVIHDMQMSHRRPQSFGKIPCTMRFKDAGMAVSMSGHLNGHEMLKNGLVPSVSHLVAARKRKQLIPLAVLVRHAPLSEANANITGHVLYPVWWYTQAALE